VKKYIGVFLICFSVILFSGCRDMSPEAPDTNTEGRTDGSTKDKNTTSDTGDTDSRKMDTNKSTNDTTNNDVIPSSTKYQDGTYTEKGDAWEHGNEEAMVVISDGKIKEVTLRRLDKEGKEVDYEQWTGKEINGKVYPDLKKAREDMANAIVDKQTYDVDSISGATVSSENWKLATKRALEEAK